MLKKIEIAPKIGPWKLSDLDKWPKHNHSVFSCFHCGGGSTMGYKLAGFNVLGGVEIDPQIMALYKENHKPRFSYLMGVEEFNKIPNSELPKELLSLDILDGSPPCSSFSMAGAREDKWGKKSYFREGQAAQVLDDLFFHFIETANKLKPKIVIAENVKGLVQGNARGYVKEIFQNFISAGYSPQLFLLNASRMGVPQSRERTFFIATRSDLKLPQIKLSFNETSIGFLSAVKGINFIGKEISPATKELWSKTPAGKSLAHAHPKGNYFTWIKVHPDKPINTLIGGSPQFCFNFPNSLSGAAYTRLQTFPDDYNYLGNEELYICGMSVPPFMMQRVALQVYEQLLCGDSNA